MRSPVWMLDEILERQDGDDIWLYGLVKDGRRVYLGEVFPGLGYARTLPRSSHEWWCALVDIWRAARAPHSAEAPGEP